MAVWLTIVCLSARADEVTPAEYSHREAKSRQQEAEAAVTQLDAELRTGAGLDRLAGLLEQRQKAVQAVAAAREAVTEAALQVQAERRPRFDADLARLQAVLGDSMVPTALKATAWHEFFALWPEPDAPAEPTGFCHYWTPDGLVFLFNRTIPDLSIEMVALAPGGFQMGCPAVRDESPVTAVTLTRSYWLGKTELTQAQWTAIMGHNPSRFKGDNLPVENVSWGNAMEFCRKLTAREQAAERLPAGYAYSLPTEAQWEYACRAGSTGDYAGELDAMAWYGMNSAGQTHPAGQKQANAWGLHDMHGNVWEWCLDWYAEGLPGGSVTDPTGPLSGSDRIRRGGGWRNDAILCRSADRSRDWPGNRDSCLGFRLALVSSH